MQTTRRNLIALLSLTVLMGLGEDQAAPIFKKWRE